MAHQHERAQNCEPGFGVSSWVRIMTRLTFEFPLLAILDTVYLVRPLLVGAKNVMHNSCFLYRSTLKLSYVEVKKWHNNLSAQRRIKSVCDTLGSYVELYFSLNAELVFFVCCAMFLHFGITITQLSAKLAEIALRY